MDQAAEAAAAAAGGIFSTGALFPLEVIKTNLQARTKGRRPENYPPGEAGEEGGLAEPANIVVGEERPGGRVTSRTGHQEGGKKEERGKRRNFLGQEEQDTDSSPSVVSVAQDVHDREGFRGFYRGVCYAAGQSGVEKAAYFYGYGWLKALSLRIGGGRELSTTTDLVLGYLAEALHLPFTIPIEVVVTKIVTSREKTNAFAVIQGILAESGPAGFFKGIKAYIILCLKPAIQYTIFNRLKTLTLACRRGAGGSSGPAELTALQAFVIGAASRAVATVVVFPYIRAKVIMMTRAEEGAGGEGEKSTSSVASLVSILNEGGISSLFQGITPEITRGVLSSALMLMVKEKIHSMVRGAIVGQKK